MRFTISVVALAATVSAQSIQTISQISDGQIQAPPATATAPVSTPAVSVPDVSAPVSGKLKQYYFVVLLLTIYQFFRLRYLLWKAPSLK